MTDHEARRAQRETLEQMLNEVPGSSAAEAEALLALFSTASGPAQSGELPGEAAAMAAFRAANPAPVVVPQKTRRRAFARLLTVKAAAAAVVVTSMGGVALASTGVVSIPLVHDEPKAEKVEQQKAERADAKPAPTTEKATKAAGSDALKAAAKAAAAKDRADAKAGRDHAASFAGLCNSYTAGNKAEHGKSLATPAYKRLVQAAADADATVESFCGTLAGVEAPAEDATVDAPGRSAEHRADGTVDDGKAKTTKPGKSATNKPDQAIDGDAPSTDAKAKGKSADAPRNDEAKGQSRTAS